jgi:hypothetical protein
LFEDGRQFGEFEAEIQVAKRKQTGYLLLYLLLKNIHRIPALAKASFAGEFLLGFSFLVILNILINFY